MAIREQRIDIGFGTEILIRAVYDYRFHPEHWMETGFVQYDSNHIPVWRQYDPGENGLDASWRDGIWRNIHSLSMPTDPAARKARYVMVEHNVGEGTDILLPSVEVRLTFALLEHLKAVRTLSPQ